MDFTSDIQPRQIVFLEHEDTRLYAEVIQVVSLQICWVRPLLLVRGDYPSLEPPLYDLRSSSDLLWPLIVFRPALDTEVIPLLTRMLRSDPNPDAQQQLSQFIHQVWQASQN